MGKDEVQGYVNQGGKRTVLEKRRVSIAIFSLISLHPDFSMALDEVVEVRLFRFLFRGHRMFHSSAFSVEWSTQVNVSIYSLAFSPPVLRRALAAQCNRQSG